jgi:hypothetical protein
MDVGLDVEQVQSARVPRRDLEQLRARVACDDAVFVAARRVHPRDVVDVTNEVAQRSDQPAPAASSHPTVTFAFETHGATVRHEHERSRRTAGFVVVVAFFHFGPFRATSE